MNYSYPDIALKEKQKGTEIVYLCSPNYESMLFTSVRSLLASNTLFDKLTIVCVGNKPRYWRFEDPRLSVEEVKNVDINFFLSNKAYYICKGRKYERLVYIDSDTIIMKPLNLIWENTSEDILARPASAYNSSSHKWEPKKWSAIFSLFGKEEVPYLNAGLIIFQNFAHQKLDGIWFDFTQRALKENLFGLDTHSKGHKKLRFSEQYAFSLAVGIASLSYKVLDSFAQSYGWLNESFDNTCIYHTGGYLFWKYALYLEDYLGINQLNLPVFKKTLDVIPINLVHIKRILISVKIALKPYEKIV